jgi:L-glyceraldehyde 3-phosphate reductase
MANTEPSYYQESGVGTSEISVRSAPDVRDKCHDGGAAMYRASDNRYETMPYARCGRSGLDLPKITLGLWQNFGSRAPLESAREMLLKSFDRGITHFDLANNYGPEYGTAEENFGRVMASDLAPYRDELVISTKAGYDMWPGPYGQGGGGRKYMLASLDQSLARMGLDYVDIFYSHRFDPTTPLEETMGALTTAVGKGKALYVGVSSYSAAKTREAAAILRASGTPALIHQPSYSMLNRWVEAGLLDAAAEEGMGVIAFSPLGQGMLTDKYLNGVPDGSRASENATLSTSFLTDDNIARLHGLNDIAARRGQSLAQMAIAWVLRDPRITSALVGASRWSQIDNSLVALENLDFSDEELAEIDVFAVEGGIDLWATSSGQD